MTSHRLGRVLGLGHASGEDNFKRMLKNVGHIVPVERLLASGTICLFQIVAHCCVVNVNSVAALHPEDGLDHALDIVAVGIIHLRRTVDERMAGGHLTVGALHGDGYRLFRGLQKRLIEAHDGDIRRVELRRIFDVHRDTVSFH